MHRATPCMTGWTVENAEIVFGRLLGQLEIEAIIGQSDSLIPAALVGRRLGQGREARTPIARRRRKPIKLSASSVIREASANHTSTISSRTALSFMMLALDCTIVIAAKVAAANIQGPDGAANNDAIAVGPALPAAEIEAAAARASTAPNW